MINIHLDILVIVKSETNNWLTGDAITSKNFRQTWILPTFFLGWNQNLQILCHCPWMWDPKINIFETLSFSHNGWSEVLWSVDILIVLHCLLYFMFVRRAAHGWGQDWRPAQCDRGSPRKWRYIHDACHYTKKKKQ